MSRPKTKDSKSMTLRLDVTIYDRLEQFSSDSGQSKTVAMERAIVAYMDDYYRERAMLDEIAKKR